MFCSHCGKPIQKNERFCPACGQPVSTKFTHKWKRFLIFLGIVILILLIWLYLQAGDLENTVKGQLQAIKDNKLTEAYYGFTSKDFQASNSFEKFKEFIRSFPILQNYNKMSISYANKADDTGDVKAIIETSSNLDGEVSYKLIKEDDQWKILGMQLSEFQKVANDETNSATKALLEPVEKQLKALQNKNLQAAYQEMTSQQFQKAIPFEKFKEFVAKYPVLSDEKSYDFKEHFAEGDKGTVSIVLNPDHDPTVVQYLLSKENGLWKISLIKILGSVTGEGSDMIAVVQKQLDLLKQNEIDETYSFISDELQKETPLETYRQFIHAYPAFINHNVVDIKEPYVENGIGKLNVELKNDQGTTVVEYALGHREGKWKILGIHIDKTPEPDQTVQKEDVQSFKMRDLISVIQSFLAALKEMNLEKAYLFTSSQFHEENSLKDFEEFIKKHPEFIKSTSSRFEKLIFNNSIATLSGDIHPSENTALPVEFDLIQEDGKWKILHIFIMPAVDKNKKENSLGVKKSSIEFPKIVFGTKINDQGIIEDQTTSFKQNNNDIYVNLYVHNGVAGDLLDFVLRHVESGSSIPALRASIQDSGDSMLTLVFSPPSQGWPKGNYQLRISTGNNAFKTYTFKVE